MRRIIAKVIGAVAALSIVLIGITLAVVFLSLALYRYLLTLLNAPLAAVATGVAALVLCLILALIIHRLSGSRTVARKKPEHEEMLNVMEEYLLSLGVSSVLARKLRAMGSKYPFSMTLGFAAAGLALGWSPRLRAFIKDLV